MTKEDKRVGKTRARDKRKVDSSRPTPPVKTTKRRKRYGYSYDFHYHWLFCKDSRVYEWFYTRTARDQSMEAYRKNRAIYKGFTEPRIESR